MQADRLLTFGSYRWDPHTGQLWRGKQEVSLTGKAVAVLRFLVERVGQVVTKEELFQAVWSDTVVSDSALSSCIQEVRHALHDNAKKPRYIETVHRRGFCFRHAVTAQPVTSSQLSVSSIDKAGTRTPQLATGNGQLTTPLVGRKSELTQLHGWLAKALGGQRQVVFVTGEPGIGKTALVDTFLQSLASRVQSQEEANQKAKSKNQKAKIETALRPLTPVPQIGRGQCIEHYGVGEAYLPILESLGRLCREPDGQHLIELLSQHAPTWLVQMPALLNPDETEALHRKTAGATRERMLRELAEALEIITAQRLLILWLEDLHWSDVSTLDWLAFVARRQEPARLLVLGTYRPVDVMAREHPLKTVKQELQLHGHCQELALDFLHEGDVEKYLAVRFSVGTTQVASLRSLAHVIHRRTDGNPLFMVNLIEHLLSRGVISQTDRQWVLKDEDLATIIPENLRQLIEQQITRISPDERKVLEAASVAGAEFSAAAVAVAVETTIEVVEEQCTELARREQFLRTSGTTEWPDGTVTAHYSFLHALYQDVLYERLTARRRQRLHQQIGEREEQAYGEKAREIAAELAVHFERGRDYRRAIQYLQQAGENASQRSASVEAVAHFTRALELLKTLPDTPKRAQQELLLQVALGGLLVATKGIAAPEVKNAYARARELCQLTGDTSQLSPVLQGLCEFYGERGEYQTALELGEQLLALAQRQPDPVPRLVAHQVLADHLFWLGEFATAREHLEHGIALYDAQQHRALAFRYGYDPGVICRLFAAIVLWVFGYPEQALKEIHTALSLARELSHLYTFVCALHFASRLHQLRREAQVAQERAETEIALSTEQGFALFLAGGSMYRGWALVEQGQGKAGIAQIRQGLTAYRATGAEMAVPYFLALLAEACGKVGEAEQGLTTLVEALAQVEQTGERWYEAELYRIKGELTLAQSSVQSPASKVQTNQKAKGKGQKAKIETSPQPLTPSTQEAEACFLKAIAIAQKQQAKSIELRAVISLSRLWQQQGKQKQAHKLLAEIYSWFTEGFDTKDLQEAKALLEVLH